MKIEPIILEGKIVRLEPLQADHWVSLYEAGSDAELCRWTTTVVASAEDMRRYVDEALGERQRGISLPFVTIEKSSNEIVGSTRFGNIDANNRRAEIGWTWITPRWQRSSVNTEAKLLMLGHAFETWQCIRVELKTDALNEKSRRAIRRIGGTEEGVFRQHMITETGRIRDTVYFSILDSEWARVKENLVSKLESRK
jgi:RimJ/RimL family protein N-acetyltransferase